jgi:hypothetical protein
MEFIKKVILLVFLSSAVIACQSSSKLTSQLRRSSYQVTRIEYEKGRSLVFPVDKFYVIEFRGQFTRRMSIRYFSNDSNCECCKNTSMFDVGCIKFTHIAISNSNKTIKVGVDLSGFIPVLRHLSDEESYPIDYFIRWKSKLELRGDTLVISPVKNSANEPSGDKIYLVKAR